MPRKISIEAAPAKVDVVILCGGRGERLREVVRDRPKPMADVDGRPFLDILLEYAGGHGFRRFVFCTGFMGDTVEAYYRDRQNGRELVFSREPAPLGTAGALKYAERHVRSNPFLVMNGDSFCPVPLPEVLRVYAEREGVGVLVVGAPRNPRETGVVVLNDAGRIVRFEEKAAPTLACRISCGIYCLQRGVLDGIAASRPVSLEYDVFPALLDQGCYGFETDAPLIDIGTPERYEAARPMLRTFRASRQDRRDRATQQPRHGAG